MIKYSIKKHKQLGCYVLWKEGSGHNSFGCRGIFHGTKQECEAELKKIKESRV